MGGCRCTYKDCFKATRNSENFHFFHYPIKDPKRCMEWIKNAQKPRFAQMSHDQLRNKVVCQLHFEDSCFTNESKRRLVHNAVPTLDGCEVRSEVVTVEILQSDSDANVFSVDTNKMMDSLVSNCPTYFIQNGDIVPAKYSGTNISNHSNMHDEIEILPDDDDTESESLYWTQTENTPTDPLRPTITKSRSTPISGMNPLNVDVIRVSKIVERHSKEIAKLNRTMRKHIFTNKIIGQLKKKNRLINQLRGLLPSSLYTIVSLHLSTPKMTLSKDDQHFVTSLYTDSPSTYKFLSENYNWKLPSTEVVEKLISDRNNV